jgi:hypothetical protein
MQVADGIAEDLVVFNLGYVKTFYGVCKIDKKEDFVKNEIYLIYVICCV